MITRRAFLRVSGAGGLAVMVLPSCKGKGAAKQAPSGDTDVVSQATWESAKAPPVAAGDGGQISAWLHIADNDVITYFVPEAEMGQGIHTAVALVIGAELGGAWQHAVATTAPLNPIFGRQSTGGSTSIRLGFEAFRLAGATARMLLVKAAAQTLKVPEQELEVAHSKIRWTRGDKSMRFGELARLAATIEFKGEPTLRADFPLGTDTLRLDSFDKATGRAIYGIDVQQPDMLIGKAVHSPSVGGAIKSVDDKAARALAGVRDVVRTASAVVVLADHTWAAMKGRDALVVEWKEPNSGLSDASITAAMRKAVDKGRTAYTSGDAPMRFKSSKHVVEAEYSVPYLAHAPMEPLACVAKVSAERCDIWTGTQSPSSVATAAAEVTGLPLEQVFVHSQFLGGGFGRRSQVDYVREAVEAAKLSGKTVKLIWDREDDIRGYQYRPAAFNKLRAAVDPVAGTLLAWEHRIASPSILKQFAPLPGGVDGTSIDGIVKYAVPDMHLTYSDVDLPVPIWFWRSVGHSQNGFIVDAFMNEAAAAAGRDPLEFRLSTQISRVSEDGKREDNPRLKKVLEVAAEKAGWGSPAPSGVARGIAATESFGSFCAQVAEVSLDKGRPRVHRVVCVIDCGQQINPKTITAQMESGIVYGLSAALYGNLHFEKGRVKEGNFDSYRVLRINEMPVIETTIIDSTEAHGGVGEPGTPPIAGALAGALYALRGEPVRSLPVL